MSADTSHSPFISSDSIPRDIVLWRRKKQSLSVIIISTATWVLLELYQFSFITVASWITMFIVTSLFLYGNLVRLFRKEEPKLPGLEISEARSREMADTVRRIIERGGQWMMHVSAEREWFVFVRVVAFLCLLSYIGGFFDFLTLAYIGLMGGMSIPVIYEKQRERINKIDDTVRIKAKRCYETVDQKLAKQLINKVSNTRTKHENIDTEETKEKKLE